MKFVHEDYLGGNSSKFSNRHTAKIFTRDRPLRTSRTIIDNSLDFTKEYKSRNNRYYHYLYNSVVDANSKDNIIYGSKNVSRKVRIGFKDKTRTIEMDFGVDLPTDYSIHKAARQFDALNDDQPGRFSEYLYGNSGNDTVFGYDGADYIDGGVGNDVIYGGADNDFLLGGKGNDLIFTGDLSDGQSDMVYGGSGADTFFIGETTSSTTSATAFDGLNLALSLAGDVSDLIFTVAFPKAKVAKEIAPMLFDGLKAMVNNNAGTTTVEDVTKATFATIHDFNPREDTFVIPLAEEGNHNIKVDRLTTGRPGLELTYKANGKTFAEIYFDETLELSDSAIEFYEDSLLETAMIIEEGSVVYGAGDNPIAGDLYDELDASDQSGVDTLNGRFMVLGAYSGTYLEDSDVYPGNNLYGTHLGDQIAAYEASGDSDTTRENDGTESLFGYGGDDLFYTGGGVNLVFGGESKHNNNNYTEYNDSDTVSYVDATEAVVVDLSNTLSDKNGNYAEVKGAFVGSDDDKSVDKLYSIENIAGGKFADTITGDSSANILLGQVGDDELNGGAGDDRLIGGAGDDRLIGGAGDDSAVFSANLADYSFSSETINGVEFTTVTSLIDGSTDTLSEVELLEFADHTIPTAQTPNNAFEGGAGNDNISGGNGNDVIRGQGGNDVLRGKSGNDQVFGGDGDDELHGGADDDVIKGGNGNDLALGGTGNNIIDGGTGADTASYFYSSRKIDVDLSSTHSGENGKYAEATGADGFLFDKLYSIENITGGKANDTFIGDDVANTLIGNGGNDWLRGNDGDDTLFGGDGDDTLFGGDGDDDLYGGKGNDSLYGDMGRGGGRGGDDNVDLSTFIGGNNTLYGGAGDDILYGGLLSDSLYGEDGNDTIIGGLAGGLMDGGNGDDIIHTGMGSAVIYGGNGDDVIHLQSGLGNDVVYGGTGNDTVKFSKKFADYSFSLGSYHGSEVTEVKNSAIFYTSSVSRLDGVEFVAFADKTVSIDSLI
ncbi:MAG: calcium-binding protein [Cyanobacteria bacterium P01_D01_bin.1]